MNANLRDSFPSMTNLQAPESVRFEKAIYSDFVLAGKYGNYELLKKKKDDERLCMASEQVG